MSLEAPLNCAEHPTELVVGSCARCGKFICAADSKFTHAKTRICFECFARVGPGPLANWKLDLLTLRMILEPGLHFVGMAIGFMFWVMPDRGGAKYAWPYLAFETALAVVATFTAYVVMRAQRAAPRLIRMQLLLGCGSIVAFSSFMCAVARAWETGTWVAAGALVVWGAAAVPFLRVLRSDASREHFVR